MTLFDLRGRVALVTGSTRGLGHAMALGLLEAGATVVLNGRAAATVAAQAEALRAQGNSADSQHFDVFDEAASLAAVEAVAARHGRIDIFIGNAGIGHRAAVGEWTGADWDRVFSANLRSQFLLAQAAARGMIERRFGRIIFTTSIAGLMGRATIHAYAASKAGLAGLTRSLAAELGASGITCNSIAPGYFKTDLNAPFLGDLAFVDRVVTRTALHRWGEPAEIAGAAVFLASDAAAYVTGHQLVVDGGFTGTM